MFKTSAIVEISDERCVGCTRCVNVCPSDALAMDGRLAVVEQEKCVGCFKCLEACIGYDAISVRRDPNPRELATPITDSAAVATLCATARLDPAAVVCVCTQTTAAEVAAAILEGIDLPEEVTLRTGARAKCGMWCLAPVARLLQAGGIEIDRSPKDSRIYGDGDGTDVGIWSISDDVASKYPEYRIRETREAIAHGRNANSPSPWFPDVAPGGVE